MPLKPVKREDLGAVEKTDAFSQTVNVVKAEAAKIERVSYSLEQRHIDLINDTAAALTHKEGKPINASKALRHLLDRIKDMAP